VSIRQFSRLRAIAAALVSLALSAAAAPAHADFQRAVAKHAAKDFEAARVEFLQLAELGDAPSQFNLGAMSLRGEGVPKDTAVAVGWMIAAAENGYEGLAREKIDAARAALAPADAARAQAIVDRYGKAAIAARVLPADDDYWLTCENVQPARTGPVPDIYWTGENDGFVVIAFTIGADGLAHDPEVVLSVPHGMYDYAAQKSVMGGRHTPAMRDGHPVEMRTQTTYTLTVRGGGALWNVGSFGRMRQGAAAGDPGSQYIVGIAGVLDSTLGMDADEASTMVLRAGQGGIPQAQYWAARRFDTGPMCRDAVRSKAWLDAAVTAGYAPAQIAQARRLLEAGDAANVARVRELVRAAASSEDPYVLKHVVALSIDPRLAPVDAAFLRDVGKRLPPPRLRVDPLEDEAVAAAFAADGQWDKAVDSERRALDRANDYSWNTDAIAARLASYQAHRAWSGDLLQVPPRTTPPPPLKGHAAKECDERCERSRADEKRTELGTRLPK
jgi:TPR repeat protein